MKTIFYIFALISLGIFVYSAITLSSKFGHTYIPGNGKLLGFDQSVSDPAYDSLLAKFITSIKKHNEQAEQHQSTYFWLSFLVTALTAGSTLVSALQAAKKSTAFNPEKFAILLAILTFFSTLCSFASSHFNELKTTEAKTVADLGGLRSKFFLEYNKEPDPGKRATIISIYDQDILLN